MERLPGIGPYRGRRHAYRPGVLLRTRWLLAPILAAAALAGLTGVAAYHLGPWMAGAFSGAGSLGTALATPAPRSWLRWVWPWRAATG